MSPDALVPLARVGRPHGLRGELRVFLYNEGSELLFELGELFVLHAEAAPEARRVEAARRHGAVVLVALAGLRSRTEAEALKGAELAVPRAVLPAPDEDEVYHVDLLGLAAVGPQGESLGVVREVLRYPSADAAVLESDAGLREVPLLAPYLGAIDLDAGTVVLRDVEDFEVRRPRRRSPR